MRKPHRRAVTVLLATLPLLCAVGCKKKPAPADGGALMVRPELARAAGARQGAGGGAAAGSYAGIPVDDDFLPPLIIPATGERPKTGAEVCAAVQRALSKLGDDPTVRVLYTPPPPVQAPEAVYVLRYQDLTLPVPVRDYDLSLAYEPQEKSFEFFLITGPREQASMISLYNLRSEPMEDFFAADDAPGTSDKQGSGKTTNSADMRRILETQDTEKKQESGDTRAAVDQPTPVNRERAAFTRRLFGKAPDGLDILDLGYQVSPATLKCDPVNYYPAIRDAAVLTLKSAGGRSNLQAHRNVGLPGSILERSQRGERRQLALNFRSGKATYSFGLIGTDAALAEAFLRAAAFVTRGGEASRLQGAPIPPRFARILDLVNAPTVAKAEALRKELAALPQTSRGVRSTLSALDHYLKAAATPPHRR